MSLTVTPATLTEVTWARDMISAHHYLRKPPDRRSRPLYYAVRVEGIPAGCLAFGRPESTRCFAGGLTYGATDDVSTSRAAYDRWEVLALSRVWFSPDFQPGGRYHDEHGPRCLPGFRDRAGVWRSALASTVIRLAMARVGFDYLTAHPPCFVEQPYQIRAVLSYCDTRRHRGVIYRCAGFQLARCNSDGIETWWTPDVAGLSPAQDTMIRNLALNHPRSIRIRNRERTLFDSLEEANGQG